MFVALVNFGLKVYVFYVFCEVSSTVSVHVHVHIGLCQPKTHLVLITWDSLMRLSPFLLQNILRRPPQPWWVSLSLQWRLIWTHCLLKRNRYCWRHFTDWLRGYVSWFVMCIYDIPVYCIYICTHTHTHTFIVNFPCAWIPMHTHTHTGSSSSYSDSPSLWRLWQSTHWECHQISGELYIMPVKLLYAWKCITTACNFSWS